MSSFFTKLFSKKSNQTFDEIKNERKKIIGKKIHKIFLGKVVDGPYKGVKILPKEHWSNDLGSKILGFYEKQIQETVQKLSSNNTITTLVNFGAAEGYHLTGLIKNQLTS